MEKYSTKVISLVEAEQFIADCKTYEIGFYPDFLEYISNIDDQCAKLKDLYFQLEEILEIEELYENEVIQLQNCLDQMEQVFSQLKTILETYQEEFELFKRLGEESEQIFAQVEYMHELDKLGSRVYGDFKKHFLALDLESLEQTIKILQRIINFKSKNEAPSHLSDTAYEIKAFCKDLGSLDDQFLPYALFWKLPPKLLRLSKSIENIKYRALMFSWCKDHNFLSSYLAKAIKVFHKIHDKYLRSSDTEEKSVKIGGSSGLKLKYWALKELRNQIRTDFHHLLS